MHCPVLSISAPPGQRTTTRKGLSRLDPFAHKQAHWLKTGAVRAMLVANAAPNCCLVIGPCHPIFRGDLTWMEDLQR